MIMQFCDQLVTALEILVAAHTKNNVASVLLALYTQIAKQPILEADSPARQSLQRRGTIKVRIYDYCARSRHPLFHLIYPLT